MSLRLNYRATIADSGTPLDEKRTKQPEKTALREGRPGQS
jgi:hypothetical protein